MSTPHDGVGGDAMPRSTKTGGRPRLWRRFVSRLAAVGAFLAKFGALLVKLKYVTLIGSILVSIAAYAWLWGWPFALGFVGLLFVHEMGHVLEARRQGVPVSLPTFLPFLGALIRIRRQPSDAYQEAKIALGGPVAGLLASGVLALLGVHDHSQFTQALAYVGFFLNLFNLLPALPLDGGRVVGALHPVLWLLGLLGLVAIEFVAPSPIIPLVILFGGIELLHRWRNRNSPASRLYFSLRPAQRLLVGISYLGLVAVALYGMHVTYLARTIR